MSFLIQGTLTALKCWCKRSQFST